MLYNYIMELKYYLILFLIFSICILVYFFRRTERFEQKLEVDNLIKMNKDFESDDLSRETQIMKNLVANVLNDQPSCNVNPIVNNLHKDESDLRIKFLHQYIKLNGLKWALKKINELEN